MSETDTVTESAAKTATKKKSEADAKAASLPVQAAQKLAAIRTEIGDPQAGSLVERTDETNLLIMSIVARTHLLLIGVPGVAKSMIVREFFSHVEGATYFEALLAKDTPSEQVLGPVSLKGLENDVFKRIIDGKLPTAMIAFLDEVFKANSTILNAMLSIINERIFHNNGGSVKVPLWTCIGASNELPGTDRDDLRAFRDRFGATKIVDPVRTDDGFKSVLRGQVLRDQRGTAAPTQHTIITAPEIEAVQEAARMIDVPDDVLEDLAKLNRKAEENNLHISARRFGEGVRAMKALAVLNGRPAVLSDDITIFQHFLWNDPEDARTAYQLTLDYAGVVAKKAAQYRTQFDPIKAELNDLKPQVPTDGTITQELAGSFAKVQMNLKNLAQRVEKQIDDARGDKRDTRELDSLKSEIDEARRYVREEVLGMGF